MELLSGGDMIARFLADKGVDCIYGYPGGAALHIYDALYRYNIKHVLVRHEQAAVHMADGYARATGKPGVVLVTSGPGATNTITGIATAYMDAIPNFAKLAESFGHIGMVIDKPEDLEKDLKIALGHKNRLVFVDVITDQTENVYPMIVSGKGHHEMHLSSERELA